MVDLRLAADEQRVLGCLIEKQLSTPDNYPLTLNALINACNQSTNRDPVVVLDEAAVQAALDELRDRQVVWFVGGAGRVTKFDHRLADSFGLSVQELAILAELLLRGPQTAGELRNRSGRMYAFQDLAEADAVLAVMLEADPPLVARLPRQPGTKETRYAHLLGDLPEAGAAPAVPPAPSRSAQLEAQVAALREELAALRAEFDAFKAQFD